MTQAFYETDAGRIRMTYEGEVLLSLGFCRDAAGEDRKNAFSDAVILQIREYLTGCRKTFTIPYKLSGTPFQMLVWQELEKIPYGETASYGEIARRIGRPKAVRAVGGACNRNPVGIIVPCHRVVGADGSLTGYAGGLAVKKKLLALEREKTEEKESR